MRPFLVVAAALTTLTMQAVPEAAPTAKAIYLVVAILCFAMLVRGRRPV